MPLVLDASALVVALLDRSPGGHALRERLAGDVCHAPHLVDAEVGNVLRRRVLRGELDAGTAETLLLAAAPLMDHRHAVTPSLARAAWRLRENLSFSDALSATLARALDVPLVTADERLRRAPGLPCVGEPAI